MIKLFSYGTLRDEQIQQILYGRRVEMEDAVLHGYASFVGKDEYFFLQKSDEAEPIYGKVLHLTEQEMWITDQWEEIPEYEKVSETISVNGDFIEDVYIYVKKGVKGEPVAISEQTYSKGDSFGNYKEARIMKDAIAGSGVNYTDVYITIPCFEKDQKPQSDMCNC